MAKQEELRKFEKLKVYEIVKEKEFERDPKAIKIGSKWVLTNKSTKTEPMIKARMVGKEFADETKKAELFAGIAGLSALRYRVSKLATNMCGEERKGVGLMDVKSAFLYGRGRRPFFLSRFPQKTQGANWKERWQNWWDHRTGHVMLHRSGKTVFDVR